MPILSEPPDKLQARQIGGVSKSGQVSQLRKLLSARILFETMLLYSGSLMVVICC